MLTERGRFVQPESGAETIKDMERIAEPIATWASENLHFETEDERQERLAKPPCIQRSGESDIDFWTRWSVEGNGEPFETLQDMYNNWKWWCEDTGRKTGSDASFAKKLRAVFPKIRSDRPKNDKGKPLTVYLGVKLRRDTAF
jgi:phage/plasmid-associated DNA primase